jgi:hypothetical protein
VQVFLKQVQDGFIMICHHFFAAAVAILACKLMAAGLTGLSNVGSWSCHEMF